MTFDEAMRQLKESGSAQTRKTNAIHGIPEPMFGVLWGTLRKMAKKIKFDQGLADKLWATGNYDAKVLALLVADPEKMGIEGLDTWARQMTNSGEVSAMVELAERSPWQKALADRWSELPGEWIGATGFSLISSLAKNDPDLDNAYFKKKLHVIEETVHGRENHCRYTINNALIAIGKRNFELWEFAKMAYQRIGKIKVEMPTKDCKLPDPKVELKVKPAF